MMLSRSQNTALAIAAVTLAVAGFALMLYLPTLLGPDNVAEESVPILEQVQQDLRSKIVRRGFTAPEQAALEEAMNDRFPQGSRVPGHTTFEFDGKPTSCGSVRPKGSGILRRYIYRNDYVMVEGDASPADFAMFWQICQAGGAA